MRPDWKVTAPAYRPTRKPRIAHTTAPENTTARNVQHAHQRTNGSTPLNTTAARKHVPTAIEVGLTEDERDDGQREAAEHQEGKEAHAEAAA